MEQSLLNKAIFIIPCYNEAERIDINAYSFSLENNNAINILFVNDGSTDNTAEVLENLMTQFPQQIEVLNLASNKGKAEAVRQGVLFAMEQHSDIKYVGYFDAVGY